MEADVCLTSGIISLLVYRKRNKEFSSGPNQMRCHGVCSAADDGDDVVSDDTAIRYAQARRTAPRSHYTGISVFPVCLSASDTVRPPVSAQLRDTDHESCYPISGGCRYIGDHSCTPSPPSRFPGSLVLVIMGQTLPPPHLHPPHPIFTHPPSSYEVSVAKVGFSTVSVAPDPATVIILVFPGVDCDSLVLMSGHKTGLWP
ncbi:hypothetical protein BaRGS_00019147 [Batillaria attramentaria]|uniref:Uncharacterized protein n=1 Tax=Batillaria attramentaria TaxID=370345 RepID=A0ABD0KR60_9CAEN